MEDVGFFVTHSGSDLINFLVRVCEQPGGLFDPYPVQVSVEGATCSLQKKLSEIRAAVAEKRRDLSKLQGGAVIMPYVIKDIVKNAFSGIISDRLQDHFKLFGKILQYLIEIEFVFDQLYDSAVVRERDIRGGLVAAHDVVLYLQKNIRKEVPDMYDVV